MKVSVQRGGQFNERGNRDLKSERPRLDFRRLKEPAVCYWADLAYAKVNANGTVT